MSTGVCVLLTPANHCGRLFAAVNSECLLAIQACRDCEILYVKHVQAKSTLHKHSVSTALHRFLLTLLLALGLPATAQDASLQGVSSAESGSRQNFTQTVIIGSEGIGVGGGLLIGVHWQHRIALQFSNPSVPNHVSVTASGGDVVLRSLAFDGLPGEQPGVTELPFAEVSGSALSAGQTIRISYRNLEVPTVVTSQARLPLYLRRGRNQAFEAVNVESFRVLSGEPSRLVVHARSPVLPGEDVGMTIRAEDRFGNLASRTPSLDLVVDGNYVRRLEDSGGFQRVDGITFDTGGTHNIEVSSGGGSLSGRSNAVYVDAAARYRVHWHDFYRRASENIGLPTRSDLDEQLQGLFDGFDVPALAGGDGQPGLVIAPIIAGGHRVLREPGSMLLAVPEIPTDPRGQLPGLVEIQSGGGSHEWLLNHMAQLGHAVGISGSSDAFSDRKLSGHPATGVLLLPGETADDAIISRRTYVTTGPRASLWFELNGAMVGSRTAVSERRSMRGFVRGDTPIANIELIKNGRVIETVDFEGEPTRQRLRVSLSSDSRPAVPGLDLPRNPREWLGYIQVRGASVAGVQAPGFAERAGAHIAGNPSVPGRVDFITWTHGNTSSFEVALASIDEENLVVELNIRHGFEDVSYLPQYRKPAATPAIRQLVSFAQLQGEGLLRQSNVDGYTDAVLMQLSDRPNPTAAEFAFVDIGDKLPGDYYYVRVTFQNDHRLWSSPIYIGGWDAN